ncbi:hypothetical protein ZWY2020_006949 [Hordeum vulgare]|nr:hypothetical protein ZWY2020_006949 [Hordeum vulgare]
MFLFICVERVYHARSAPVAHRRPAIYKSREVGRRSPLPNIAAVLSCCVALLYGCSRRDGLVIGVNVAGAVMQAGYVGVFVYFSPAWRLVPLQHCAVATVTYAALICFHLFGLIDAGGLAYAAEPAWLVPMIFYNVSKVWKDMSMECMPLVIVLVLSLVSTPLWIVYAYGRPPRPPRKRGGSRPTLTAGSLLEAWIQQQIADPYVAIAVLGGEVKLS